VESGTHTALPTIRPSNLRNLLVELVEVLITPLPPGVTIAMAKVGYADKQEAVVKRTEGSVDKYVTEREAYEQYWLYRVELICKTLEAGISEKPQSA
jgi:ABC-type transporter lipoprotein component MlaA